MEEVRRRVFRGNLLRAGIILGLTVLVLAFSGCGEEQEKTETELLLMNGWGGAGADHVAMRAIYRDFMKKNPDIRLVLDSSPDISITIGKGQEMLAVDRMPDILSTNGYNEFVKYAVKKGYALDLMPYIQADEELAGCIPDSVYESQKDGDALYTVPDVVEVSGYWYNKDIFREAGITELPRTWDGFWEMCGVISDWGSREGNGVVPVLMESGQAAFAFLGARVAGGGETAQSLVDGCPERFAQPEIEEALEELLRIYRYSGNMNPSLNENDALDAFNQGKAAMYFNGAWANMSISPDISAGIANYPTEDGEQLGYESVTSGYVISSIQGPEKTEASIRFLKYILSEDVQRRILKETKQVPINPSIRYSDFGEELPLLIEAIDKSKEADIKIHNLRMSWGDENVNWMKDHLGKLLDGTMDSRQFLKALDAEK